MRNSIKAAMAAVAGGGLLLGGAGSLAYWDDSETESSQTVTSGQLDLSAPVCGSWNDGSGDVDIEGFRIVPGDTLTRTCDFTVSASGDNLSTEVTFVAPTLDTNTLAGELDYGATYALNAGATADLDAYDNATPAVTDVSNGDVIHVTYTVALPTTSDNDSNSGAEFTTGDSGLVDGELTAVLSQLTVTVTQV